MDGEEERIREFKILCQHSPIGDETLQQLSSLKIIMVFLGPSRLLNGPDCFLPNCYLIIIHKHLAAQSTLYGLCI